MFKTKCYLLSLVIFFFTANTHARESVTPADIYEFGWEYIGTKVSMTAILDSVYACRQPSNKGSVCARLLFQNKIFDVAIFKKEITSRSIKPFVSKCIEVVGYVRERDIQTEGAQSKVPLLIIEEITESNKCKPDIFPDYF
jgi:hypothetical protein